MRKMLEFQGETRSISEWSEITGIPRLTIHQRLNRGFSVEEALTLPLNKRRHAATEKKMHPKMRHPAPDSTRWGKLSDRPLAIKLPQELYDHLQDLPPEERNPWIRQTLWDSWKTEN